MAAEFGRLARTMLADYDARAPGRLFAGPIGLTLQEAYALQAEIARLREARGEPVIGYKIGCTSQAVREQLGIGSPIFARLFGTECHTSGARLTAGRYANLAVEGELAVRLATDLSCSASSGEADRDVIDSIFPVIELHQFVLRSPKPCAQELIATNGMHAGFVLSERPHRHPPIHPRCLSVRLDGEAVGVSLEPWTMADPMASLHWLAARLAEQGLRLSRGQIVLTGSPLPLYPIGPGARVVVEAPPLGSCRLAVDP